MALRTPVWETLNIKAFGLSIREVLSWKEPGERDLDLCELWSGVGSLARAAEKRSLKAVCFDIRDRPDEDLTTLAGFRKALSLVRRIRSGGLLMMGPPCCSWVWMNSVNCKRSEDNDFLGDWSYEAVHKGNVMFEVAIFFFHLGLARGVVPALENPQQSYMWKCGPMVQMQAAFSDSVAHGFPGHTLHSVTVFRCAFTDRGKKRYRKPFQFMSTGEFFAGVARQCTCTTPHTETVVRLEGGRCRGDPAALAESASYPLALGEHIVALWVKSQTSVPVVPVSDVPVLPRSADTSRWASSGSESDVGEPVATSQPGVSLTRATSDSESEVFSRQVHKRGNQGQQQRRHVRARQAWGDSASE